MFEREGTRSGLRRIVLRLARFYLFQIGLLLITLGLVRAWTSYFGLEPAIVAPILNKPVTGFAHALTLHAVPAYLDILPLYIVLFAAFPLIYTGLHERYWLTLGLSADLWLAINIRGGPNLPNWPAAAIGSSTHSPGSSSSPSGLPSQLLRRNMMADCPE